MWQPATSSFLDGGTVGISGAALGTRRVQTRRVVNSPRWPSGGFFQHSGQRAESRSWTAATTAAEIRVVGQKSARGTNITTREA